MIELPIGKGNSFISNNRLYGDAEKAKERAKIHQRAFRQRHRERLNAMYRERNKDPEYIAFKRAYQKEWRKTTNKRYKYARDPEKTKEYNKKAYLKLKQDPDKWKKWLEKGKLRKRLSRARLKNVG